MPCHCHHDDGDDGVGDDGDICATFADELIPSLWLKLNIFQTDRSRNTRSTLENHNERMREARMCDETHEEQSAVVNC